eukprot:scaffold165077_cov18-Tisochrysis_lutea.AAC.1
MTWQSPRTRLASPRLRQRLSPKQSLQGRRPARSVRCVLPTELLFDVGAHDGCWRHAYMGRSAGDEREPLRKRSANCRVHGNGKQYVDDREGIHFNHESKGWRLIVLALGLDPILVVPACAWMTTQYKVLSNGGGKEGGLDEEDCQSSR